MLRNKKKIMSYSLPHELLTPLTSIIGFAEILVDDYKDLDLEKIGDLSQEIRNSAERLSDLVKRIMYYKKLEEALNNTEEIIHLRKHFVRTHYIVIDAANRAAEKYNRKDDISADIEDGVVVIAEHHLRELIMELVSNAAKFSVHGTEIKILGVAGNDDYSLFVIDSGKGMSEEEINTIGEFMQFNRKKDEPHGAGLGLSIAAKIVSLYNGEIEIESVLNKETIIRMTFPIYKEGEY